MQEFLLVGGSNDGRRVMLTVGAWGPPEYIQVGVPILNPMLDLSPEPQFDTYKLHTLVSMISPGSVVYVYAIRDMPVETIMEKLIDRYGR